MTNKPKEKALVVITGQKRAGKDTLTSRLVLHGNSTRVALADEMKVFTCRLLGIELGTLERLKVLEDTFISPFSLKRATMRTFLQELGQGMKDLTGDDLIWCKILANKMDFAEANYVVSDIRFPFEEQFFRGLAKEAGIDFMAIRVKREGCGGDNHESERFINDVRVDAVIDNNGTIDELDLKLAKAIANHLEDLYGYKATA